MEQLVRHSVASFKYMIKYCSLTSWSKINMMNIWIVYIRIINNVVFI